MLDSLGLPSGSAMTRDLAYGEALLRRLPLPLAQLHRQAQNALEPFERHQAAYFLWEAALKLLGSVAVVTYAELAVQDPKVVEALPSLARPSLGDWWEAVRLLVTALAGALDSGCEPIH